jgi:hypothetical protein
MTLNTQTVRQKRRYTMSNTRTITDKTIAHPLLADVLLEQTTNLTQGPYDKNGANKHVYAMLEKVARRAVQCALLKQSVDRPNIMDPEWHHDFANAVERAMIDAGFDQDVVGYVEWFRGTMPKVIGSRAETKWCYYKIATYAGQCATMLLYGLDPALLTMSHEEAMEAQMKLLQIASDAGTPILVVEMPD